MLGDSGAGGGSDERGGGRNIESAARVSTSAAGVDQRGALIRRKREGKGLTAHRFGEAGDLGGSLTATSEGAEQRSDFYLRRRGGEDLQRLASLHEAFQLHFEGHGKSLAGPLKQMGATRAESMGEI